MEEFEHIGNNIDWTLFLMMSWKCIKLFLSWSTSPRITRWTFTTIPFLIIYRWKIPQTVNTFTTPKEIIHTHQTFSRMTLTTLFARAEQRSISITISSLRYDVRNHFLVEIRSRSIGGTFIDSDHVHRTFNSKSHHHGSSLFLPP